MATTTLQHPVLDYTRRNSRTSVINSFMSWCTAQEKNRLLWLGVALSVHGCILTPITVLLLAMTGANIYLIASAIFAMTFVLITNLAALPTKYTIPTFVLSVLVDIGVIIAAFSL